MNPENISKGDKKSLISAYCDMQNSIWLGDLGEEYFRKRPLLERDKEEQTDLSRDRMTSGEAKPSRSKKKLTKGH